MKLKFLKKIKLQRVRSLFGKFPALLQKLLTFLFNTTLGKVTSSIKSVQEYKNIFVYRFFWGRGNLYKQIFHISLILITTAAIFTGITSRISSSNASANFEVSDQIIGNIDLLEQGGSIQTVLVNPANANFRIFKHTVKEGDTLESLAKQYGVSERTIKDSNRNKVDYYGEKLTIGSVLQIPEINGVLYKTKSGDTLDWIMTQVNEGDKFEAKEINRLKSSSDILAGDLNLLIPGATLEPPPHPIPQPGIIRSAPASVVALTQAEVDTLNGINFVDPLSNPDCSGYGWSRGFTSWHNGVDLAKGGGCPISAAAGGRVRTAGWGSGGQGYHVIIDHGYGVTTYYYHGDGNIWVTPGQQVVAGQPIMYMGCTGWCTGTHLHLGLTINDNFIDAAPYIPYWRP